MNGSPNLGNGSAIPLKSMECVSKRPFATVAVGVAATVCHYISDLAPERFKSALFVASYSWPTCA
jgi:hypothetical protein